MLFSSPPFFVFFAVYFLCHVLTPPQYRLLLITVGSTVFYSYWNPAYVWVPHALMLVAYVGVRFTMRATDNAERRRRLTIVIVSLLVPLVFFKYTDFIYQSLGGRWLGAEPPLRNLPLPLGISFITFSLIAYAVDTFRGQFAVQHSLQRMAAYVTYFPHLIAGPILRPRELIPQLDRSRRLTSVTVRVSALIFAVGLVKKLVFADSLGPVVDAVYEGGARSGADYLLAIYGFSLQIYCDFSGYTDMAIALALLLGVRLPNNFARPYCAPSITEFWRRWHITLSRWLRDYLYFPLGGNRLGPAKEIRNVMITMGLGGLWHGANWTFVIWGLVHGAAIAASHVSRRLQTVPFRVPRWLLIVVAFHFVTATWVLFRAPDLSAAWTVLSGPFVAGSVDPVAFAVANAFPLVLLALFLTTHRFDDHRRLRLLVRRAPTVVIWPVIGFLGVLAVTISAGSSAKFIYFDF